MSKGDQSLGKLEDTMENQFPRYKILQRASGCIFLNDLNSLDKIQLENASSLNQSILPHHIIEVCSFFCVLFVSNTTLSKEVYTHRNRMLIFPISKSENETNLGNLIAIH